MIMRPGLPLLSAILATAVFAGLTGCFSEHVQAPAGGQCVAAPDSTPQGSPIIHIVNFAFAMLLPIGAADMPVVIALLNSYAGLAASATGFALSNKILIIAGTLDGASGLILSILMCKAMNRSILNVLFGAFGQVAAPTGAPSPATTRRSMATAT